MVAAPIRHAEGGDLRRAQGEFEALLARSDPDAASDLLTAFGIGLWTTFPERDEEELRYRRAALLYLERAIPAAAARFGPDHPEVALVLHTYGDALRQASAGDPPRAVDRALARAYLIRARALGLRDRETISGLYAFAEVRGLPSRTAGDPRRIDRVGQMYEDVIRVREANPDPDAIGPEQVRSRQLEMFVRNGRVVKALEVARSADVGSRDRMPGCEIGPNRRALADILLRGGRKAAARAVVRPSSPQPPGCGVDDVFTGLDS